MKRLIKFLFSRRTTKTFPRHYTTSSNEEKAESLVNLAFVNNLSLKECVRRSILSPIRLSDEECTNIAKYYPMDFKEIRSVFPQRSK